MRYYWRCPSCAPDEQHPCASLEEARKELEKHEREVHKGRPVGVFGKYFAPPSASLRSK